VGKLPPCPLLYSTGPLHFFSTLLDVIRRETSKQWENWEKVLLNFHFNLEWNHSRMLQILRKENPGLKFGKLVILFHDFDALFSKHCSIWELKVVVLAKLKKIENIHFKYRIVASRNTCYYSGNQKSCTIRFQLVTPLALNQHINALKLHTVNSRVLAHLI
jgi:hypothetical protein